MKIAVAGAGFVGLSMAVLLAQNNQVKIYDLIESKIKKINGGISPIEDSLISDYLKSKNIDLNGTIIPSEAFSDADYVIVATPTNYDTEKDYFDTSSVKSVIQEILKINTSCTIVIKSTVPIGYVDSINRELKVDNIIFSPEFLREGSALYDNLYPSRIIVGERSQRAECFANLLENAAIKESIEVLFTGSKEAEAIKLFSNTYLAMRVAFFNELDNYAIKNNLDSEEIINGMGHDSRIGSHYNNPSFGYGGYCFPKDTKQLLANFKDVPNNIIEAIVLSNSTRKDFISNEIILKKPKTVGVFRLVMKEGSDNFRSSSIIGIMNRLHDHGIEIIIYEPIFNENEFNTLKVFKNLEDFKRKSDLIIANRLSSDLDDVRDKVFTRDIFTSDQ